MRHPNLTKIAIITVSAAAVIPHVVGLLGLFGIGHGVFAEDPHAILYASAAMGACLLGMIAAFIHLATLTAERRQQRTGFVPPERG